MQLRHARLFFVSVLALLAGCSTPPPPPVSDSSAALVVVERENEIELSVPASRVILGLPKGAFVKAEAADVATTANPRYFVFEDQPARVILSGWFEPAHRYENVRTSWEASVKGMARTRDGQPDAVFSKIGPWETGSYVMDIPSGPNTHMRAHLLLAGTWIELHLSSSAAERKSGEQLAALTQLIRSIRVQEKR